MSVFQEPKQDGRSKRRSLLLPAFFIALLPAASAVCLQETVVQPDAKVEKLAGGFKFTEGPAVDREGNVFFSDIPNNRIRKWSVEGKLSTFRENSGGANGLFFDQKGNLLACEGSARQLTSLSSEGKVTVLADKYNGKRLNSPNDLWIDPKGGIYFTDPRYGPADNLEQDGMHVYHITPDREKVVRVISDLLRPNGIVGTTDGRKLYVADEKGGKTWVYSIQPDGGVTGKKLFASQGSDGMTLDEKGNLYLTGNAVDVYSPSGKKIASIQVPERPANVCFGGKDRKTLFITARTSLYALRMDVRGQ